MVIITICWSYDAYNWTGWNALLGGRKLWRFWRPNTPVESLYTSLQPKMGGIIGSQNSQVNTYSTPELGPDFKAYPAFIEAGEPLEVIQEAGEVVVIPGGWFHQVYHLTDAVALASQCASKASFGTIIKTILEYNRVSRDDCQEFGVMPEVRVEMDDPEFRKKAQVLIDTVIACAKDALENEPFHPSKQAKAKEKKKKPWWKQEKEKQEKEL